MDTKTRPLSTRDPLQGQGNIQTESENLGKKKIFEANGNEKKTGVVIFT